MPLRIRSHGGEEHTKVLTLRHSHAFHPTRLCLASGGDALGNTSERNGNRGLTCPRVVSNRHAEDDNVSDVDDIKLSLEETLSSFKTFGSFATLGKVPGDVSTGLSISRIGRIAFPLIDYQAKQIIEVCHKAPFGRGSETVVDENVRKTWELNPDAFELLNPLWPDVVAGLLDTVSKELGCDPDVSVSANLYKLLLY
ncbi:hypothetical protein XANCAGTX0491_003377 [Xanthoria calcicola]